MKSKFENCLKSFAVAIVALWLWAAWARAQGNMGAATIEFAKARFTASENARSAAVVLKRTGATNTAATVDFATADGTATAGVNYSAKLGPVTFATGQIEETISIPLHDNSQKDGNQTVKLALLNPGAGVALGALSAAELVIADDDGARSAWVTFGLDRLPWLREALFDIPLWQYLASLIFIFLAFYVSKLLDWLVHGQLRRWAATTETKLDDLLLQLLRGPVKIVAFVILLHVGLRIFSWPEWFADFFSKGLKLIVAVSITYMALKLIDLLLGYWRQRAHVGADKSFNDQLLPIIRNTVKVFIVIVAVLLTLQNLGLNITSLIASLSIGGLALSLAAQDTVANLFGAVAVLTDKPCQVGDRIKVEGYEGVVEAIGLRSTRVRNADGHLITIPNKTMGNATITNIASRPFIRTVMTVGITYATPMEKVKRALGILEEVFTRHPLTQEVLVTFNKFADSALNIEIVHLWNGTDQKLHARDLQALNLAVKERFDREGIEFAFPTQTVYVKSEGRAA